MSNDTQVKQKETFSPIVMKAMMVLKEHGYLGYLFGQGNRSWIKDQYRRMTHSNFILVCLLGASLICNYFQCVNEPKPEVFGLTPDLRVVKIVPLHEDFYNSVDLTNWAAGVVSRTLSLSFNKFNQELQREKQHFFDDAYDEYVGSMESSGVLPRIRGDGGASKSNTKATLTAPAIVTSQGIHEGVKTWLIEMPLVIAFEFQNGSQNRQHRLGQVIVQRVPITENPRGVKIRQVNLEYIK